MEKIPETTPEELQIENIEKREPILDHKSTKTFPFEKIDQQWLLLTETIRQEIISNPETRQKAIKYIKSQVTESLADDFLNELSLDNNRILKLKDRYQEILGEYLKLEEIPDNQINHNITNTKTLGNPINTIETLQKVSGDESEYHKALKRYIDSGDFTNGITAKERLMIIQRYRFARDIKLLALSAEMLEKNDNIDTKNKEIIKLDSGTTINLNTNNDIEKENILNPQKWKKRKQIKDRVYEIEIDSFKYILKERKTSRHEDTPSNSKLKSLTSLEEFQTAKDFQENGTIEQDDIKINWEIPLASVNFPDDFQFTIFKYEDNLIEKHEADKKLVEQILEHREGFEEEFHIIKKMTTKFKDDPRVIDSNFANTESKLRKILELIKITKTKQIPKFTFEDFARTKAMIMLEQADLLAEKVTTNNGYADIDGSDCLYKINLISNKPQLERLGIDLEYHHKYTPDELDNAIEEKKETNNRLSKQRYNGEFLDTQWYDLQKITKIQKAGYFAMLELEKINQEVKNEEHINK